MNLLMSANDKYLSPLKVMLTSFCEENRGEHHNVFFLYSDVDESRLSAVKSFFESRYDISFILNKVTKGDFAAFPVSHHFSIEIYYRFLAADIVPSGEDRVLWLDVDTIVRKSLRSFYYQDFDDKMLVVCRSINKNPGILLKKLQCPDGTVYFNSGVILFNLKKIREHYSTADYYKYYEEHKSGITWLDQDILNGMYALKTKIADYRVYNRQMFEEACFSEEELKEIKEKTAILHYIGAKKPWMPDYRNPCKAYWDFYAKAMKREEERFWFWQRLRSAAFMKKAKEKATGFLRRRKKAVSFLKSQKQKFRRWRYFNLPPGAKIFLTGTPEHNNIGDSAIVIAELLFIKSLLPEKRVKEITVREQKQNLVPIRRIMTPRRRLFWHGGGNMGDLWYNEEAFRRQYLIQKGAPDPIVFPQTIYYSDTPEGRIKMEESKEIYNKPEITVTARERTSYEIMRKLYPDANILLAPDIVLSAGMSDFGAVPAVRSGVLFVTRKDLERVVDESVWMDLEGHARALAYETRRTDMISDVCVTKENRAECVRRKMQEFCGAELVITDRLHGMVFAALTGTPCIAFGNNHHKVKGTYDWISYLPYIKFAENIEEARACMPTLLGMKDCHYDKTPLLPYFEELAAAVRGKHSGTS